jgi:hypothetical protein
LTAPYFQVFHAAQTPKFFVSGEEFDAQLSGQCVSKGVGIGNDSAIVLEFQSQLHRICYLFQSKIDEIF